MDVHAFPLNIATFNDLCFVFICLKEKAEVIIMTASKNRANQELFAVHRSEYRKVSEK